MSSNVSVTLGPQWHVKAPREHPRAQVIRQAVSFHQVSLPLRNDVHDDGEPLRTPHLWVLAASAVCSLPHRFHSKWCLQSSSRAPRAEIWKSLSERCNVANPRGEKKPKPQGQRALLRVSVAPPEPSCSHLRCNVQARLPWAALALPRPFINPGLHMCSGKINNLCITF